MRAIGAADRGRFKDLALARAASVMSGSNQFDKNKRYIDYALARRYWIECFVDSAI